MKSESLVSLKDKVVAYYKKSRLLSQREEKYLGEDILEKPKRSLEYIKFFKNNVSQDIKGKRILDIGSGDGIYALHFSKMGAEVAGIDIDSYLLKISNELALQNGTNANFVAYINGKMPFSDNYFDYCYCLNTFEHMDNPVSCLEEIHRVIKKGGLLHISFPNRLYPYDSHAQLFATPWLPYKAADFITHSLRKRNLDYYSNLRFCSYRKFMKILNESKAQFSIVHNDNGRNVFKKGLMRIMRKINQHHTILTQNISVILKKITK